MSNAVEPALFGASVFIFFAYHFWLFFLRNHLPCVRKSRFLVWETSYRARAIWAEEVAEDTRDALQTYGIQNLRNAITAASFMATTCALIAVQGLFTSFLDPTRINRLREVSDNDPLAHGSWASPSLKLGMTMGVVLFSFLCFLQSIRLMVHLGFLLRVVPCKRNTDHMFDVAEAAGLATRASTCLTLGIRSFYAFIPLVMWAFGATALFLSTVIMTCMLYFSDDIPRKGARSTPDSPMTAPPASSPVDVELGQAANGGAAGVPLATSISTSEEGCGTFPGVFAMILGPFCGMSSVKNSIPMRTTGTKHRKDQMEEIGLLTDPANPADTREEEALARGGGPTL